MQDELDESYLLAWEILSSHDPNISKLVALLSEINEIYHELTSLMTTTCESYSIEIYICSAYHKQCKEHVIEWFCVVSRLGYCVFGDSITQISNYFSDSTSTVNFRFISKSYSLRFLKHSFKCMRADAALRISELKGIKMRAKQRMRCFNACIAIKKVDQKSDASFGQPKATQGNAESLTSSGPVHALEYTGSLSHVGPVTESLANEYPGPVHALEYTGSLSHVVPVTECLGPVHALEYTGSPSHVVPLPFTECLADDISSVQPHLSAGPVLGPTLAQSCLSAGSPALADLGFDSAATGPSALADLGPGPQPLVPLP